MKPNRNHLLSVQPICETPLTAITAFVHLVPMLLLAVATCLFERGAVSATHAVIISFLASTPRRDALPMFYTTLNQSSDGVATAFKGETLFGHRKKNTIVAPHRGAIVFDTSHQHSFSNARAAHFLAHKNAIDERWDLRMVCATCVLLLYNQVFLVIAMQALQPTRQPSATWQVV